MSNPEVVMKENFNEKMKHENHAKQPFNFMYDMFKKMMQMRAPDMSDHEKNAEMYQKNMEGMMKGQEIAAEFFQKLSNIQMQAMKDYNELHQMNVKEMQNFKHQDMSKVQEAMEMGMMIAKKQQEKYMHAAQESSQKMMNLANNMYQENMNR